VVLILAVLGAAVSAWWLAAGPGRTVPTPDVLGQTVAEATANLTAAGLSLEMGGEEFSETVPADAIVSTDPAPGDGVREGGTVVATVSKGPERYEVPSVDGLTPAGVQEAIGAANLAVGSVREEYDDTVPVGDVVTTDPKPGSVVRPGTKVDVIVSKGPRPVTLPDLEGKRSAAATATLEEAGLVVEVRQRFSDTVKDGLVISVRPAAGTVVDSGSTVTLVVSKGPPPVEVPNLIDMPRDRAVTTLRNLGLRPKVVEGDFSPLNRVISQSPGAGESIPRGSTVTIRII
jgi:serine/threonine-protein kinase